MQIYQTPRWCANPFAFQINFANHTKDSCGSGGKKTFDIEGNLSQGSAVSDFAVGLGLGGKWVTKNGFIFEVNAGYGKLLFNADKTDHDIVAKFGFHLGYRF